MLDTWFSSALWPFATLGWPEETPDLAAFYPGDLQTTAREIIRLWENRMIFMGLELLGEIPFTDVIIHSTVLAPDGRRMSKSLGTGIDPLDVIAEHGADATRYGLLKMSSTQDVRFSYGAVEEGRKLANKLWNVARLILANAEGVEPDAAAARRSRSAGSSRGSTRRAREVEEALERVRLRARRRTRSTASPSTTSATGTPRRSSRGSTSGTRTPRRPRSRALERLLALLHPVMPHVTEEIWTQPPGPRQTRLIVAPWPEPGGRTTRGRRRAPARPGRRRDLRAAAASRVALDDDEQRIFDAVVRHGRSRTADGNAEAEVARLDKEVARAERMLANEHFVANAPAEVVEGEREKLDRYRRELDALRG